MSCVGRGYGWYGAAGVPPVPGGMLAYFGWQRAEEAEDLMPQMIPRNPHPRRVRRKVWGNPVVVSCHWSVVARGASVREEG